MTEKLTTNNFNENAEPAIEGVALLERTTWAPWISYSKEQLWTQRQVFRPGQFEIRDPSMNLQGILSTNRINWSGSVDSLPTWNEVAGSELNYEDTFVPDGNTLALMSISVDPATRGTGLYRNLIRDAQDYARRSNLQYLIGDFRPSGFGAYKRHTGDFDFAAYCKKTRHEGQPHPLLRPTNVKKDSKLQDPWLRAVKRLGMEELRPDPRAMVVHVHTSQLEHYMRDYKPENWWQVTNAENIKYLLDWHQPHRDLERVEEIWECGEAGTWYVDRINEKAAYIESNLWGELPIRNERYDLNPAELKDEEERLIQKVLSETSGAEEVRGVWLHSYNPLSNLVRTWESRYYPEVVEVVDDEVERHSAFLAIVNTKGDHRELVHTARITSPKFAVEQEADEGSRTYFAAVDELISKGLFTTREFLDYYQAKGIDLDKCISVETNQRIDKKPQRLKGLKQLKGSTAAGIAYLSFYRAITATNPEMGRAGIFASINRASILSFRLFELGFEPLMGRDDLRYPVPGKEGRDYFLPIFIPYSEKNVQLFSTLNATTPQELVFD